MIVLEGKPTSPHTDLERDIMEVLAMSPKTPLTVGGIWQILTGGHWKRPAVKYPVNKAAVAQAAESLWLGNHACQKLVNGQFTGEPASRD